MSIGRLYHVIHVVDDLDIAVSFYRAVFPFEVYTDHEWSDYDKRLATLAVVAENFVIELIEPSRAEGDLGASLPKFAQRFGSRLHSMAWFADDLSTFAETLRNAGIRVIKGGYGTIFTHPKDTFGQLQFQLGPPGVAIPDPRLRPGWQLSFASVEHPLGVVRCSYVTTMVADLDAARELYLGPLQGRLLSESRNDEARHAFVLVGTDTVVDLAQPLRAGTRLHADLERAGQLPHACTFLVRDLPAARRHLDALGIAVIEVDATTVLLDPGASLGALLQLTAVTIEGDPR